MHQIFKCQFCGGTKMFVYWRDGATEMTCRGCGAGYSLAAFTEGAQRAEEAASDG